MKFEIRMSNTKELLTESQDWNGIVPPPVVGDVIVLEGSTVRYLVERREFSIQDEVTGGRKAGIKAFVSSLTLLVREC